MRILCILTLGFTLVLVNQKHDEKDIIKSFLTDLKSESMTYESISRRYLALSKLENAERQAGWESIIHQQVDTIKKNIYGIEVDDLQILGYEEAPKFFELFMEKKSDLNNAYVILYEQKTLGTFLIEGNKLKSISTMTKGKKQFFIKL